MPTTSSPSASVEKTIHASVPPGKAPPAATANLVTSDTVLRGPTMAPEVSEPAVKKPAKRSEQHRRSRDLAVPETGTRDGFKRVYSVYSVPSGESSKPVIVVRPLPLNAYSSSSRF